MSAPARMGADERPDRRPPSYREVLPLPRLRSLVECYWQTSGAASEQRVLPDGCIDVVLIGDGGRARAVVVGAMTRAHLVAASAAGAIGVRFRPGEAARVLSGAARELTDADAPLEDLWGDVGRALEARLVTIRDVGAAGLDLGSPALDAALAARLAGHAEAVDVPVRIAVSALTAGASVREAAAQAGLSERHLGRRFAERVGVAPKLFARVVRLRRATSALAAGASIADAGARAGYVDQPHFTRDCVALALATPADLARGYARSAMSDPYKTDDEDLG